MIHQEMLVNGCLLGGPCDGSIGKDLIRAPWDGHLVGTAAEGGWSEMDSALHAASEAFPAWRDAPHSVRQDLLSRVAAAVRERKDEFAGLLCDEVGKPITMARAEVDRLALTLELSSQLNLDPADLDVSYDPRGAGTQVSVQRFPLGVVLAITPYNWPFNLAAHKLGPALVAGNTVVLKGSSLSPLCTLQLARIFHECGCPPGVLNAVHVPTPISAKAVRDPRVKKISFTGSPAVGWNIKAERSKIPVTLELGGNAFGIIEPDADLAAAARDLATSAFGYAGQICISAQHALVHRSIYSEFCEALIEQVHNFPTGDPREEKVLCGPLISEEAAIKVETWIEAALQAGGREMVRGLRTGTLLHPSLIELPEFAGAAKAGLQLASDEVFGPVLTVSPYHDLAGAISWVQASSFGIHTSLYTQSDEAIGRAYRELDVSGLLINRPPSLRFDSMPYGGQRQSGFGREGVEWALHEMTTPKVLIRG